MYYTNYKKRNGYGRNHNRQDEERGYSNSNLSYRGNGGRFNDASMGHSYSNHNDNERYESRHRNHGGYYNDGAPDYNSYRNDERNFFERTGDRIREGWNSMTRDDDHDNDYLKSRHNRRQAGYDNGDYRNRPSQDEEYGYRHQRASYGYEGDNRTYNGDYDRRNDEYKYRRDGESNRYNANSNNDDYYTGYREFDRDSERNNNWRGRYF